MTVFEFGTGFGIIGTLGSWIFYIGYARGKFNYLEKQILSIEDMKHNITQIQTDVSWIKKELEDV